MVRRFLGCANESLAHASGNWVFWMDSDDTISREDGEKLRSLAEQPLETAPIAYVMQVHCPGPSGSADITVVDHVKMFRNDKRLRFEGRIHEQILPAIRRIDGAIAWTDIFVTHSGAEHSNEARRRKQDRDLRLLEMELTDRPDHPFVLFNLGMTYADMDESKTAVDFLKRCLLCSSPEESHVRKAYALLVGCLLQFDRDEEARRILGRGRELFPNDSELLFRLGILEQRAKNYENAIAAYQGALDDHGDRHFSSRDRGITGYKARHNLAGVYRELGRLDHAELQWRLALSEQPGYCDGWRGLVDALLDQRKYTTLEVEIDTARGGELPGEELACASARLATRRGNVNSAIEVLDAAISAGENIVEPLRLKCQLLFEQSAVDEAIVALESLCQLSPRDGAAWHNLGTAYQRAGREVMAVDCYQRSLAVRPDSETTSMQLDRAQQALSRAEMAPRGRQTSGSFPPNEYLADLVAQLDCRPEPLSA